MQDFITRELLVGVKAQIRSADSVLIFEWTTNHQTGIQDMKLAYILLIPEAGDYLLHFSKEGYVEKTVPYKVNELKKSEKTMKHSPVLLRGKAKERTLGEATEKATKVKFLCARRHAGVQYGCLPVRRGFDARCADAVENELTWALGL